MTRNVGRIVSKSKPTEAFSNRASLGGELLQSFVVRRDRDGGAGRHEPFEHGGGERRAFVGIRPRGDLVEEHERRRGAPRAM